MVYEFLFLGFAESDLAYTLHHLLKYFLINKEIWAAQHRILDPFFANMRVLTRARLYAVPPPLALPAKYASRICNLELHVQLNLRVEELRVAGVSSLPNVLQRMTAALHQLRDIRIMLPNVNEALRGPSPPGFVLTPRQQRVQAYGTMLEMVETVQNELPKDIQVSFGLQRAVREEEAWPGFGASNAKQVFNYLIKHSDGTIVLFRDRYPLVLGIEEGIIYEYGSVEF